ncbi:MAG: ORF6N domain-containing protein, partial [Rickettsiales bacterium]|nr:ORF6N domain-containing protein [Rickettsiales bacterium]
MKDIANINNKIYEVRGQQVMLDSDLARIYKVETRVLNQAVKRNIHKFPPEFRFQLTQEERDNLMFQIGTSSWDMSSQFVISNHRGHKYLPFVFTEHGVVMLASVLNSKTAVEVNIAIVKAFVAMRHYV